MNTWSKILILLGIIFYSSTTLSAQCAIFPAFLGNQTCQDNGTPSDPSDDTFTFQLNMTGNDTGVFWTADDPNNSFANYGILVIMGPYPLTSSPIDIVITDNLDPTCTFSFTVIADCPAVTCSLDATASNYQCDNQGTSDPSDDTFTVDYTVTGSGPGGSWISDDPNNTSGPYNATTTAGPFDILFGVTGVTISDISDPLCNDFIVISSPGSCSNNLCNITDAGLGTVTCSDNGTPSDPSDDQYTYTLDPTGTGLGSQYNISLSEGTTSNPIGVYGFPNTFAIINVTPGAIVTITITDSDDPSCTFDVILSLPPGCSNAPTCNLTDAGLGTVTCNDFGTPTAPGDDYLEVELNPSGIGLGTNYIVTSNFVMVSPGFGTYGTPSISQLFNAAVAGPIITLTITDADDPNCFITVDIVNIAPCVTTTCDIMASIVSGPTCFDNNTPSDPSDDLFNYGILVNNPGDPAGNWFSDAISGTVAGNYGSTAGAGPFPISGGPVTVTFTDQLDPTCSTSVVLTPPPPCSTAPPCNITTSVQNIQCFTNGTSTPDDDVYTFEVIINGTGTSGGWTADDPFNNSGIYNTTQIFGPYLISDGVLTVTITDNGDPTCTSSFTVSPPPPCSFSACDLQNANLDNIFCDNNGTPSDPADDFITFSLNPTGVDLGTSYSVNSSSGNITPATAFYGGATFFNTIAGSPGNGDLLLTIIDNSDPSCSIDVVLFDPGSCVVPCILSPGLNSVVCDDNGTPSDPTDDLFIADVTINGSGTGWTANDPANSSGSFGQNASFGPFLIASGAVALTFSSIDDLSCQETVIVDPPPTCSNEPTCNIIDAGLEGILCDNNGTPSDPTDDLILFQLNPDGISLGSGYFIDAPGLTISPASSNYGAPTTFNAGIGSAGNGNINLQITDLEDPGCTISVIVVDPGVCSNQCIIQAQVESTICDDNGTAGTSADDTFSAIINITGENNGNQWIAGAPLNITGAYNTLTLVGPFSVSDGDLGVSITDENNINCSTLLLIPSTGGCSSGCPAPDTTFISNASCNPIDTGILVNSFINALGCDSIVISNTSLLSSDTTFLFSSTCISSEVGTSSIALNNQSGCDSIIITTTNLIPPDTTYISLSSCDPNEEGITQILLSNSEGCDSLIITTTSLFLSDTTTTQVLSCNPVAVGFDTLFLQNTNGCDSIIFQETILDLNSIDTVIVQASSCDPNEVGTSQLVLNNQFGCDSLVITNTALLQADTTFLQATSCDPDEVGTSQVVLNNQFGCDSLVITNTTLLQTDTTFLQATSCDPSEVGTSQVVLSNQFGCDSLVITNTLLLQSDTTFLQATSCDPGEVGTSQVVLNNQFGCDSLVITNTTLLQADTTFLQATSCDPNEVGTSQLVLNNQFGCDSLVITNTALLQADTTFLQATSCDPNEVGTSQVVLNNQFGCDSLVITNTALLQADTTFLQATSCDPNEVGISQVVLNNQFGCDSLVITNTALLQTDTTFLQATSCDPNEVGISQVVLNNQFGCDSLVITNTTLLQTDTTFLQATSCDPSEVGSSQVVFSNQFGCDSLVITNTALLQTDTTFLQASSCDPNEVGTSQVVLNNQFGCDSLVITNTALLQTDTTFLQASSCDPNEVGTSQLVFSNQFGCDSLVITNTLLLQSDTTFLQASSCDPNEVGTSQLVLSNQLGCDSLVITNTALLQSDTTFLQVTSCDPSEVGTSQVVLSNQFGCDSLVITNTTLLQSDTTFLQANSCDPNEVGTSQVVLSNQFGCDSLVITNTALLQADTTFLQANSCDPNEVGTNQVVLNNQFGCDSLVITNTAQLQTDTTFLQATSCDPSEVGTSQVVLNNQFGCDSLVITNTLLLQSDTTFLQASSCDPSEIGTSQVVFSNQFGCDSLVINTITYTPIEGIIEELLTCEGDIYNWNGWLIEEDGLYQDTLINQEGCDSIARLAISFEFITLDLLVDTDLPVSLGTSVTLTAESNLTDLTYNWVLNGQDTSCLNCPQQLIVPSSTSNYQVSVISNQDCIAFDEILVTVDRTAAIFVPNVFSPNGDGRNDIFHPFAKLDQVINIKTFQLFDRWGEQIFKQENFPPNDPFYGWDGTFRSETVMPGVYVYYLEIELFDGRVEILKGDVTLLR